jgi:hypothetical protein
LCWLEGWLVVARVNILSCSLQMRALDVLLVD